MHNRIQRWSFLNILWSNFFPLYKAWFSWYVKRASYDSKNAGLDPNADKHTTLSLVGVNKQAEVRTPGRQSRKGKVNLARCRQKQQKSDTVQYLQYTEWLTRFYLDGLFCVHTLFAAWVLPEVTLLSWCWYDQRTNIPFVLLPWDTPWTHLLLFMSSCSDWNTFKR